VNFTVELGLATASDEHSSAFLGETLSGAKAVGRRRSGLFNFAVSRFGCGKSSVIKQTLEMQSENTSATSDPLKKACLARGVWVNSWSKAPPDWLHSLSPVRCSGGTLASSALGWKRQRRAPIASIGTL